MITARLGVLLVVLAVLVAGFAVQRVHLLGSTHSNGTALSASEIRRAQAALGKAAVARSYRPEACLSPPMICLQSKHPLHPMSPAAALALVRGLGLPLRHITPTSCAALPPRFRGRHLMVASTSCIGAASLGRLEAFFAVRSMNTECRRFRSLVGTHVILGITRVGSVDPAAYSALMDHTRQLEAQATALSRHVLANNRVERRTDWPRECR